MKPDEGDKRVEQFRNVVRLGGVSGGLCSGTPPVSCVTPLSGRDERVPVGTSQGTPLPGTNGHGPDSDHRR